MKSFYLREEKVPVRDISGRGVFLDEPMVLFKWAMISKNQYVVIQPKFFTKAVGDVVTIMNEKQFAKHFRNLNVEAK